MTIKVVLTRMKFAEIVLNKNCEQVILKFEENKDHLCRFFYR